MAPAVVDDPCNTAVGFTQVNVGWLRMLMFGWAVFCVTATTDVFVQPLIGLVTVNAVSYTHLTLPTKRIV